MSVRDQEENDIVFNLKTLQENRNSASTVWLGGSRANTSSPWQWTDGLDWGWQKWNQGEPNNLMLAGEDNGENCLELYIRTTTWNDEQCDFEQAFICEKNKN